MKILLTTDASILLCKERYYYVSQVSTILKRYYKSFGPLSICARVKVVDRIDDSCIDVTEIIQDVVSISSLYKVILGKYNKKIKELVKHYDLIICRCHGIIPFKVADIARKLNKPYFTESMGDAWDAYWNHGLLGKLLAPYMYFKMKKVVFNADYALYVTEKFLQQRYPCKNKSVGVSNVKIPDVTEEILQKRIAKIKASNLDTITLTTTAAVNVRYKGQQYVIKALPALNKLGINVKYILIGGGEKKYLMNLAKKLKVEEQVQFVGRKTLEEVFEILDDTDIYVQPSLQEGLPRSVIEAMSRGCACVGAKTAGIPELLQDEYIVRRKNINDIVVQIQKYFNSSLESRIALAERNFNEAKKFAPETLNERRNEYFSYMLEDLKK